MNLYFHQHEKEERLIVVYGILHLELHILSLPKNSLDYESHTQAFQTRRTHRTSCKFTILLHVLTYLQTDHRSILRLYGSLPSISIHSLIAWKVHFIAFVEEEELSPSLLT